MPEIGFSGVTKVYPGRIQAITDLNLNILQGELLVLVGPSGCGKTTTLRLLAGLEKATGGTIHFGKQIVNNWPPRRRQVAMVFQRPALYPHRTVRDNLAFGEALRRGGWARKLLSRLFKPQRARTAESDLQSRVTAAAELMGLEKLLNRRPEQLSGGQQQRVALGRALVRQPEILLLDEPLSNLDAALRSELRNELHLLHERFPATIVYVTHDPVEALALGDRVAVLREGRLEQVDCPQALLQRPCNRFVAGLVGWPPMSFVDGQVTRSGEDYTFACNAGSAPLPPLDMDAKHGRQVTLGIRPEHVGWHADLTPGRLPMRVTRVELLGSGVLVTFAACGQRLTGLALNDHLRAREGQKVMVSITASQVYLFDSATGLLLRSPAG
jgi:multiple sugar transport system ATP-binding protein